MERVCLTRRACRSLRSGRSWDMLCARSAPSWAGDICPQKSQSSIVSPPPWSHSATSSRSVTLIGAAAFFIFAILYAYEASYADDEYPTL